MIKPGYLYQARHVNDDTSKTLMSKQLYDISHVGQSWLCWIDGLRQDTGSPTRAAELESSSIGSTKLVDAPSGGGLVVIFLTGDDDDRDGSVDTISVSYTHLDVYKRQDMRP